MNCVTKEELLAHRVGCEPVAVCCPCEEIELQLEIAYEMVKCITNTEWCPELECKQFSGTGTSKLFMISTTTQKLISVTEITDTTCCGCPTDFTNVENCVHWLKFNCGGCFPCGDKNIQVCGLWGEPMPAAIKNVIIKLALEGISPGLSGLQTANGIRSATWEDFRISYSIEERPRGIMTTGYQELDDILTLYTPTLASVGFTVIPESPNCDAKSCGLPVKSCNCSGNRKCSKC